MNHIAEIHLLKDGGQVIIMNMAKQEKKYKVSTLRPEVETELLDAIKIKPETLQRIQISPVKPVFVFDDAHNKLQEMLLIHRIDGEWKE